MYVCSGIVGRASWTDLVADGQIAIAHQTISRKHMTIKVDTVPAGNAHNLNARSRITIEDLKTKHGTEVDGRLIKNDQVVLEGSSAEIMLGKFATKFRYASLDEDASTRLTREQDQLGTCRPHLFVFEERTPKWSNRDPTRPL